MRRSSSTSSAKAVSAFISSVTRLTACITVVWSRLPNLRPISGSDRLVSCLARIHRHLTRPRDRAGAACRRHVGQADVVVLGDLALDLLDGDPAVVRLQDVVQHLLRRLQRDRTAEQVGVRDQAVERALQLAHVGGDLVRQELQHLRRHGDAGACRLGLQDRDAQLEGGGVQVGDHAAAEPRAQPVLEPGQVGGRLVGGDDDLLAGIDQRVEGVEELLLRIVLADQELQVVDHQHVDRAQLVLELDRLLRADRGDEAVHELLGRHVGDRDGAAARAGVSSRPIACIRCVLPSPTPP